MSIRDHWLLMLLYLSVSLLLLELLWPGFVAMSLDLSFIIVILLATVAWQLAAKKPKIYDAKIPAYYRVWSIFILWLFVRLTAQLGGGGVRGHGLAILLTAVVIFSTHSLWYDRRS